MLLLKLLEIPGRKKRRYILPRKKKRYISSKKKHRNNILRDIIIALLSGGLAAIFSVWWGIEQWKITNYRQQLTSYKEIIVENLLFDDQNEGTKQLLKSEEKLNAMRRLTSDVLLKLNHEEYQKQLVEFLSGIKLLGIKFDKDPIGLLAENRLTDVKLKEMTLDMVDLSLSDLSNAHLEHSRLRNALLSGTILKEAKLYNAKLSGADLSFSLTLHPTLDKICRDSITELGINLSSAELNDFNLSGDELNLSYSLIPESCRIRRTKLSGADLRKANLSGANLSGANLRGTDLRDVKLEDAKSLEGAIYDEKTRLSEGQDLKEAYMIKKGAKLPGKNLSLANLSFADLSPDKTKNTNLKKTNLSFAILTDADLTGADLTGADLTGAILTDADLTDADLTGADLTGADLTDADLTGAILTDAILCKTIWKDKPDKSNQRNCNEIEQKRLYPKPLRSAIDEPTNPTSILSNFALSSNRD